MHNFPEYFAYAILGKTGHHVSRGPGRYLGANILLSATF